MKFALILLLAFTLQLTITISSFAFDPIIPDGGYKGRLAGEDNGRVHLLIQSNPGCDGCFTAIALDTPDLFSPTVRMVAYIGMPWDKTFTKFSLTPINMDANGELTHPNDNPSMMLDISANQGTKDVKFTITPAGSDNLLGFTSSMAFEHELESPFELTKAKPGEYRYAYKRKTNAVISSINTNTQDLSSEVTMDWFGSIRHRGGSFNLKEKFPGVYSFNSVSYAATGRTITDKPSYIVIFAKKYFKNYILMVNPIDSRDVLCLILK